MEFLWGLWEIPLESDFQKFAPVHTGLISELRFIQAPKHRNAFDSDVLGKFV